MEIKGPFSVGGDRTQSWKVENLRLIRIWPTQTVSGAFLDVLFSGFVPHFLAVFSNFVLSVLNHSRGEISEFFCTSLQWQNYTNSCNFGEVCVEQPSTLLNIFSARRH